MTQDVTIGHNSISLLKRFLSNHQPISIFLVTGKDSFFGSGAYKKLEPILSPYNYFRFADFEENPKVEDVKRGIELFKTNNCDLVIAVGGGSVIDMAKLINIFRLEKNDIRTLIISGITNGKTVPFAAIPTTSGTGSEATHFAVVYINNIKYSVASDHMLPDLALIDPVFTYSASPILTAVTGLDALSQAIESYWSIHSTHESRDYSLTAVKLIWNNLPSAVNDNKKEAKDRMSEAAHFAGKGINIAKTTAPHALSYGFTTNLGLAHGHAVSLFLPFFMDYHQKVTEETCRDSRGVNWIRGIMNNLSEILNVETEELGMETACFINRCNLSIDYEELNITEQQFMQAIGSLNEERLKNNPVLVDNKILSQLYRSTFNCNEC